MKWWAKCLAFHALGRVPGGQVVYHNAQQRLTASTRQTEARLRAKIEQTLRYWDWLKDNTTSDWLAGACHFELGSGWLPSVPMAFHALGLKRQYLTDLTRHLQPEAVVETATLFRAAARRIARPFARLPKPPPRGLTLAATIEPFGMTYAAPYDALANRLAGSVGFVTATHMLLHLNRATLLAVFRSIHKLLQPGGFFLAQHHLRQLFDGLESRTSPFFALRYSDWVWENVINSPMMSYNRLKAPDYHEALQEAGFVVDCFDVEPGRPEDFQQLSRTRIHPSFARYTREELAGRHLFFAARKPW